MSAIDRLKKIKAAPKQGGSGTPTVAPEPPKSGDSEIPEGAKTGPAPWRDIECAACEGSGWSSHGTVCRICDVTSRQRGTPRPIDYYVGKNKAGVPYYVAKNAENVPASMPTTQAAPVKKKKVVKKKVLKKRKLAPEPTPEPEPTPTPAPDPERAETPASGADSPRFIVVRDREVAASDKYRVVRLHDEIFAGSIGEKICSEFQKSRYFECDPFRRRDVLIDYAESFVENWKESGHDVILLIYTGNIEEREVAAAFFRFADIVL